MSAISVLHAPHDEALGQKIADALSREGHASQRVSGDPHTGDLALVDDAAIVIWSNAAARLVRLHEQARDALDRGALIPVAVGGVSAPLGFEALAPVDLSGWAGDDNDPRWRFILDEISIATQRQSLQDANVWASPPAAASAGTPAETADAAPPAEAVAPVMHYFDEETPIQAPPADEPAPIKNRRGFTPLTVALGGGVALVAAAGAAMMLAPIFMATPPSGQTASQAAAPAEIAAAEAAAPSISAAFIQPTEEFDVDTGSAPPSFGEDGGGQLAEATIDAIAGEAISGPAAALEAETSGPPSAIDAEVSLRENPSLDDGESLTEVDDATAQVAAEIDEAVIDPSSEEESAPDNDAMENLLAAIARGKEELALTGVMQEALPAEISAQAYLGNFFKECPSCPDMAALPTGRFRMGAPLSEPARHSAEGPLTEIIIASRFAIGTREITFAQWDACVADGGCRSYRPSDQGWGRSDRPVINVSFEDAQAYVTWLSRKTGERYRLPTEAEWEYAARAGATGPLGIGAALSPDLANYNAEYAYLGKKGAFRKQTTPAASFAPNDFGLFDMHGNVWEWTQDCWADSHAGASRDGSARGGNCSRHVLKGGAWNTGGWRLRSAHRIGKDKTAREFDNGFRVVRDLD